MIKKAKPRFAFGLLTDHFNKRQTLIGALPDRTAFWRVLGDLVSGEVPLRLAARDGCLALHANGQSVAKIAVPHRNPRLDIHWKYMLAGAAV